MNMRIGTMPHGQRNLITDVPGVRVGHATVDEGDCHTGVTVVLPPCRNPFADKLTAACQVFNGYGKTLGLVQVEELGTLETPIALTNTLNVGRVHDAMVSWMIRRCAEDGVSPWEQHARGEAGRQKLTEAAKALVGFAPDGLVTVDMDCFAQAAEGTAAMHQGKPLDVSSVRKVFSAAPEAIWLRRMRSGSTPLRFSGSSLSRKSQAAPSSAREL